MIKSAKEMRENVNNKRFYKEGFEQAIESVMECIEEATELGLRKTCFCPRKYRYKNLEGGGRCIDFYEEVKEEFKKHGYTFKPTGYVDGAWQQLEDICW